jgi:hypothetical protein
MPAADGQVVRALERRLAVALEAPPERFSAELAIYLELLSSNPELRAVVTAALAQEAAGLAARQAADAAVAQEYATCAIVAAGALTQALRPWLADGTLPEWVGTLLEGYDERQALARISALNRLGLRCAKSWWLPICAQAKWRGCWTRPRPPRCAG